MDISDFPIKGKINLQVENSHISVEYLTDIKINQNSNPNLDTLKNVVEDLVRSVIDSYCFVNSYSYDVDLENIQCKELNIDYTFSVIGEYNIKNTSNEDFLRVLNLNLSGKYPFFYYILADFRRAIKYPGMTASFCFRAIETLRQAYFGIYNANVNSVRYKTEREKQSWDNLNKELNFLETDHAELVQWAKRNRHGDYPAIDYKKREQLMNHTRQVINRFIEYTQS